MREVHPVVATLVYNVGFHPKNLCCAGCQFYATDPANRDRKRCQITTEIIHEPRAFGFKCPMIFEEDECESEFDDV